MSQEILRLIESLPEPQTISPSNEPEFYGAVYVLAEQCGITSAVPYAPKSWLHGWIYKPIEYVREILFWGEKRDINLVHTTEQATFLQERGYPYTYAIGAPFTYVPKSKATRIANSVLVMPPHCTRTTHQHFDELVYLEALSEALDAFEHVLFCIHPHDAESGSWIENLGRLGYPFILGATVEDKAALKRIRYLFDSVEVVTSPNLGSHIPYAGFCGCRVSVFGPKPTVDLKGYAGDAWSISNWEIVEKAVEWQNSDQARTLYPQLYKSPSEAQLQKEWSRLILGEANRQCLQEVSKHFGWSLAARLKDYFTGKRYAFPMWPVTRS